MPEQPPAPLHPHPHKRLPFSAASAAGAAKLPGLSRRQRRRQLQYVELGVTSNFSFLIGASHADELVTRAAELGHAAASIADHDTLAGVVRAHVAAKQAGIGLRVGCRLHLADLPLEGVIVYPTDAAAYGRLCQLLTTGRRRAPKGQCRLQLSDLAEHHEGLLAIALPPRKFDDSVIDTLRHLARLFDDDRLSLAARSFACQDDEPHLHDAALASAFLGVPLLGMQDVLSHEPARQPLQDVLTCLRHHCTLEQAGRRLAANAARHMRSPAEMAELLAGHPRAIGRSVEIAERAAGFNLDQLKYQYPSEVVPAGCTPMQHLSELTAAGARFRYPHGVPLKVKQQIEHELKLIDELNYAHYFLTVHDIAAFARSRSILHQGRGAAANSAVCYCLQLTAVDPERVNLLFERFVSRERDEPPDIDIDFEHERREEVIQYLYRRYGRDRAALTAEVITWRSRSAVRDAGRVLGLPPDTLDRLARAVDGHGRGPLDAEAVSRAGLDPESGILKHMRSVVSQLAGMPRHLSQHVGGFVITDGPLSRMVPVENAAMENRTVIQWDKDDLDAMGMLKIDILGLGMLSCIRRGFELIATHHNRSLSLASVPAEDPAVYDMLCKADAVGVFQVESRAQMSMLPRLQPRNYYDLVIEVAIVRPGPIVGNMVHPYLRRRSGREPVTWPNDGGVLQKILDRTLGVPLFQEQAMAIAVACAGFTPGEADQLRRAIAAWKSRSNNIAPFERKMMQGMRERGYSQAFARRCFEQIKGFSEYGFPESHAASFALLVYVSAWLKRHYPAAFAAALLNSQPMGFYAPAQIVADAKQHGVEVRTVDVHHSQWDCTLEGSCNDALPALRLGLRRIKGLRRNEAEAVVQAVKTHGRFDHPAALWRAGGISAGAMRKLASADALASMGLNRRQARWAAMKLRDLDAPLFEQAGVWNRPEPPAPLPTASEPREVVDDYLATGLSLRNHPMAFVRDRLQADAVSTAAALKDIAAFPHGRYAAVAGLCLLRQRPGTAGGITFMTLEDETGTANLVVHKAVYEQHRAEIGAGAILARGRVERSGEVVHLVVGYLQDISDELPAVPQRSRDYR